MGGRGACRLEAFEHPAGLHIQIEPDAARPLRGSGSSADVAFALVPRRRPDCLRTTLETGKEGKSVHY